MYFIQVGGEVLIDRCEVLVINGGVLAALIDDTGGRGEGGLRGSERRG